MDFDGLDPPPLGESPGPPPLWPYLVACGVVALWVDFGTIHRDQHADSLLAILASLYCWTPFMWEQDRFGMAVPLLALPFRSPMANLLAQGFLTSTSGLAVFFLLPRLVLRDASYPIAGTIGAASFLALTPHYYRFEYLIDTSHGTGLFLGLGGLILLERDPRKASWRRLALALMLVVAAHWVNSVTALLLAPLLVIRRLLDLRKLPARPALALPGSVDGFIAAIADLSRRAWQSEAIRAIFVLWLGYEAGMSLTSMAPDGAQRTSYESLGASEWPAAWRELGSRSWAALSPPYWPAAWALEAGLGAAWCLCRIARGDTGPARKAALALGADAVLLGLLTGTKLWVQINDYAFRYLFPSALLAQSAASSLAAAPIRAALGAGTGPVRRGSGPAASAAVLLASALGSYGWPSLSGVRRDLDRRCGKLTADPLDARCTHLAGDYWEVWPAVFHANLVGSERGEPRTIWGITFRSSPTYALWKGMPREAIRIGVPRGDTMAEIYTRGYNLAPVVESEVRPTIRVVRPAPRPKPRVPPPVRPGPVRAPGPR